MNLSSPVTELKGIGPRRAELLGKLGLFSVWDLLRFQPRDYLDYSVVCPVAGLKGGDFSVARVRLASEPKLARVRGSLNILTVRGEDESGHITLTWFNQPYRRQSLRPGQMVYAAGRVDDRRGLKLLNPAISPVLPGILPVYPLTKGLRQAQLRDAVAAALPCLSALPESLPPQLIAEYGLMGGESAVRAVHFPKSMQELAQARRRLAFEDMLTFLLVVERLRQKRRAQSATAFGASGLLGEFLRGVPFEPTGAQLRVMQEIAGDMAKPTPMNRLVQGDVGSGKTLPALFAMYIAVQGGAQAALMAPTELLAAQHFKQVKRLFGQKACLLTGSMKAAERAAALEGIANGRVLAVVGTHALISEGVRFLNPGVMITDEQHRFGVAQRAALGASGAHVLIMSATPIPRTLALMLYGDLDVSVLNELPPGREPVLTRRVPGQKRAGMYRFLMEQVAQGRQAYVVCPLVSGSESLDVPAAEDVHAGLKKQLPCRVGLLHGQQPKPVQAMVAAAFAAGEVDVLVCTTIIEVGVDVPNATVMVVEGAERFGLAQLHQLRGRVGRGGGQSFCFLLTSSGAEGAKKRLDVLCRTQDGFEIARADFEQRGPGEFLGSRQHGMAGFAAAGLAGDMKTLEQAQEAAARLAQDAELRGFYEKLYARAEERVAGLGGIAPN